MAYAPLLSLCLLCLLLPSRGSALPFQKHLWFSGAPAGDPSTGDSAGTGVLSTAKGFCEKYSLQDGCIWKTAAGLGVLLVYALLLFFFICGGCIDRGWCVVVK
uniref:LHPL5 n=1 Tax=Steinernema glaseri TaxID=37863 RepID=A0A1I7YWM0_9BILA